MDTPRLTQASTIAAVVLLLTAGTTAPALAQRAANTGNALDHSLQVGSGGINRAVNNFASDLAFRNAIVTGNVTGGAGFRGEVGYTGAFDFRGDLGGDDIFDYQARAFSSANVLNFHSDLGASSSSQIGMRGLDATQRSLGWGVASQSTPGRTGQIVQRQFAGSSVAQIDQSIRDPLGGAAGITVDEYTRLQGAIRSTSDLVARAGSEVNRLGVVRYDQQGRQALRVGSDLLAVRDLPLSQRDSFDGVRLAPDDAFQTGWRDPASGLFPQEPTGTTSTSDPTLPPGLSNDPTAQLDPRLSPDDGSNPLSNRLPTNRLEQQRVSPYHTVVETLRVQNDRLNASAIDGRVSRPMTTPGSASATTPASSEPWLLTLDQKLAAIRAALIAAELEAADQPAQADPLGVDPVADAMQRAIKREELRAQLRDASPEERDQLLNDPEVIKALSDPMVAVDIARQTLAGSDVVVKTLITKPATEHDASLFDRHMAQGQKLLSEGAYFGAEERFTAALFIVPGDPMAIAGRIHAQIGAGMYRSAMLNLANMIRDFPELASARFDASLLPSGDRLTLTLNRLRDRTSPTAPISQDAGILLAYLGHQLDQPDDIRRGLNAARKVAADHDRPLNPLVEILSAVWLPNEQPGSGADSGK